VEVGLFFTQDRALLKAAFLPSYKEKKFRVTENELGKINKGLPIPFYYQISDILLQKIAAQEVRPHQQIPSEEKLAGVFEVSRLTVRQAIQKLVNEGKLYRKRGHGTFVAEPKIERKVAKLSSVAEDMERAGLKPGSVILEKKIILPEEEERSVLRLKSAEKVLEVKRLRLANDQPIAIGRSLIPVNLYTGLADETFAGVVSLTRFLEEKYGLRIGYAHQKIQAVNATQEQAKLLKIKKGTSLLHMNRLFFTPDQKPIGIFETFYRGDRYIFTSTLYP
jgi:GntR family transcriptional regulator